MEHHDNHFEQPEVLADLRSGDPAREAQALRALIEHLVAQTSRDLATRRNGVHLQAESVVQRVVMRELYERSDPTDAPGPSADAAPPSTPAKPYGKFENDAHLFGRLRLGIVNRIREILRSPKSKAKQFS